ncbi:ATP-binding cassette domain-containing protein [Verticiella sediminum]|uniref:ATP-binding cassette domain-containing protein n=2 Tax=Verticiella sediminum TaxID=1247510 RepID=A0A556AGA2_9BURK|nr:ATP-binding cassette domain-containing protein [Verticiella sediminum]
MSAVQTSTLLSVHDLRVHFPTARARETVKAVDGVSFDVCEGETFGIIGESGSGKSTLGRVMVMLTQPTGGTLRLDGQDPARLSGAALRALRRDFQVVFQDPNAALDPRMRIGDSVREPLDIQGTLPRAERRERVLQALDHAGLGPEFAERYPHEISGGQKQRVNIARVLTLQPRMIVCDEVVAALDVSIQADILNLFADLQQRFGLTYVFITHDLGVVSHISDRIAVMYLGRFMELADAATLERGALHPYTQALLSAEPSPMPGQGRANRIVLQGEVPSPIAPPSGCRFRTRCRYAQARCAEQEPAWRELAQGHWVACHFAAREGMQVPANTGCPAAEATA